MISSYSCIKLIFLAQAQAPSGSFETAILLDDDADVVGEGNGVVVFIYQADD